MRDMSQAVQGQQVDDSGEQLALHEGWMAAMRRQMAAASRPNRSPLCAGCREKEARYGFQDDEDPAVERPRTLCFTCFRVELTRRQGNFATRPRHLRCHEPVERTIAPITIRR